MADNLFYIPNHGFTDDTSVIASWDNTVYCVASATTNSFKLAFSVGGSNLQYTSAITGNIRRVVSSTTTITDLYHLDGRIVQLVGDGVYLGLFPVINGQITSPNTIYSYRVGLPYAMKCRSTRLELPVQGTTQTKIKKINSVAVRHYKTQGGKAGIEDKGNEYLRDLDIEFDTKSGDTGRLINGNLNPDAYIVIKSDKPYPMTILSVVVDLEVLQ